VSFESVGRKKGKKKGEGGSLPSSPPPEGEKRGRRKERDRGEGSIARKKRGGSGMASPLTKVGGPPKRSDLSLRCGRGKKEKEALGEKE